MHRQYAHLHGRTMSYFDSAHTDSKARVLLLMHAFPLGAGMWEGQVKALPPGWRIIAPDVRGFGGSTIDDPDENPRLDDYARDAIDLLHEIGVSAAVIGGLSMGGYVALAIARRQPSIVAALLLADSRASADSPEGRANRRSMLALVEREGPPGVARDMMPKLLGPTTRESRPMVEPLVRRFIKQQSTAAIRGAIFRMMERPDSFDVLQSLTIPVAIVVGEEDALTPVEDSRKMQAAAPGAELVVIPETGHLANLERPELFNDVVRGFLARL